MRTRVGLGTYRCPDVHWAAVMAAQSGADWLDTAPNYAAGLAEQEVSQVLARYSHVRVSTKVGFIPVSARRDILGEGVLTVSEVESGYNLSPDYVRWQVARSRRALGRIPDLVFLHNPEHKCPAEQANERLYAAFTALEQACSDGEIHAYGVATWSGFSRGVFDIPTLLGAAFRAGGPDHHLQAVQLPLSLVHLAPIAQALEGKGVLADAHAAGLGVFASAPLHGGEVPGMFTRELLDLIAPDRSPAQAALSVVASAPGVRRVLLSTTKQEHWAEAVTALDGPVLSRETLKRITDVLGT